MNTWLNLLVLSPNAVTGLLSQIPMRLLNMWLCAIVTVTGVPPENTSTPVVLVGWAGRPVERVPVEVVLADGVTDDHVAVQVLVCAGPWACIVTPASPLPAM